MLSSGDDSSRLERRLRLARRARLQIDPITGEAILQSQESVILLNKTGHEILARCNGTRTLSEIIGELALQYPTAKANLASDVSQFVERLGRKGLLEWS